MVPDKVHLVGSIGLDSVEDVFRTVGTLLGRRLRRVPDGEPGGRRLWISWQAPLLRANPYLKVDPDVGRRPTTGFPLFCLADGVSPVELRFGELGYAREARASYLDFVAARERGELPAKVRFQVCLPTPMAVIYAYCPGKDLLNIEPAYERAMLGEVEAICGAIPHHDLCIQWDVCHEMLIWDGQYQGFPKAGTAAADIMARFARICAPVPEDVELGLHLCYGDFEAKHFVEPRDAAKLVDLANALVRTIRHPVAYIHMPVPMARTDDAFFQPLRNLQLAPGTELYLGVVHAADGARGTEQRIAAASRHVTDFGIATECGMARARRPELVMQLLEVHARASQEPPV
jgi:hypothetical protein